ncbi:hypothetical protein DAI22_06g103900 [Oryza sativa Japonica Group]|nr:hypothetical protein DAI22_06g103900 [Oryza sativa Japonica Group]
MRMGRRPPADSAADQCRPLNNTCNNQSIGKVYLLVLENRVDDVVISCIKI